MSDKILRKDVELEMESGQQNLERDEEDKEYLEQNLIWFNFMSQ